MNKELISKSADERDYVISRVFDAPRNLVYQMWTDPKHLANWWGPSTFTNPVCEMDVRPGGTFRIVMRAPDGSEFPFRGVYREVVPNERLIYTNDCSQHPAAWHKMVDPTGRFATTDPKNGPVTTVTFDEHNGKTTMTVHMRFQSAEMRDGFVKIGMNEGWSQSFDDLAGLLKESADESDRAIIVSRIFDAPRELVWRAMTDPKHVVHWWGPRGFSTTIEEMDLRPGGHWRHTMLGPDGADYPNLSIFKEIVKPARIVFSHGGHREGGPDVRFISTWSFDAMNGGSKTKVTIHMVFPTKENRDMVVREYGAIEGGKQTLERLGEHLLVMEEK
ncbi:MAG: SRPBCC domain-containing protein [Tepidisphaeraceae bacterium]|jgi:uncharacterized protein YndB with AHSA1/START domain